jgi:3'-phosphoadenosine 5'-phosphosulfate sulfotransferase (PAPS reductase)/FAD synthetase
MALRLRDEVGDKYETCYPFANTGQENEETLEFVHLLETRYELPVVWLEADINPGQGKGTRHKVVSYEAATRDGSLFDALCAKYGLPNPNFFHCTRELKESPILSYCRSIGWGKPPEFVRAIGIRFDELDRVSPNYKQNGLYYPLAFDWQITKPHVNLFWSQQPQRLNLKGWQGNCKWC